MWTGLLSRINHTWNDPALRVVYHVTGVELQGIGSLFLRILDKICQKSYLQNNFYLPTVFVVIIICTIILPMENPIFGWLWIYLASCTCAMATVVLFAYRRLQKHGSRLCDHHMEKFSRGSGWWEDDIMGITAQVWGHRNDSSQMHKALGG